MKTVLGVTLLSLACSVARASSPEQPLVEKFLIDGKLEAGKKALSDRLATSPDDAQARYGLGVLQLLQTVENLGQDLYRHGLNPKIPELPLLRLPVPENKNPEAITYQRMREILQRAIDGFAQAEETLAAVDDPEVKLKLRFGLIRLDLDGNGEATDEESLWRIYARLMRRNANLQPPEKEFPIGFDAADAHWMIGYTHVLRGMLETILAHNSQESFEFIAPYLFDGNSPTIVERERRVAGFDASRIADLISAIHLIHWDVVAPERLKRAHQHLLAMVDESRRTWDLIEKETDDDCEWIPGPTQTSVIGIPVNQATVAGWRNVLDAWEQMLKGELLIPHWRMPDGYGVNLYKMFHQPQKFDVVLFAAGPGLRPFIEEGPVMSTGDARQLSRAFGGNFLGFAMWFN